MTSTRLACLIACGALACSSSSGKPTVQDHGDGAAADTGTDAGSSDHAVADTGTDSGSSDHAAADTGTDAGSGGCATIGSAGGTVTNDQNPPNSGVLLTGELPVELQIPAGALATDTTVCIVLSPTVSSPPLPGTLYPRSFVVTLEPPGTHLAVPAHLSIPYASSMNAASHLFDTTAGAGWQQTPNVTDVVVGQGRVMKVDITSFGAFVAAAGCADCGLDGGDGGDGPGSN